MCIYNNNNNDNNNDIVCIYTNIGWIVAIALHCLFGVGMIPDHPSETP